jgi:dihydrofolate reductase
VEVQTSQNGLTDGLNAALLEHGLADEVLLVVYPVLLGTGKRFVEGTPPRSFELVSAKAMPSGSILSTYRDMRQARLSVETSSVPG